MEKPVATIVAVQAEPFYRRGETSALRKSQTIIYTESNSVTAFGENGQAMRKQNGQLYQPEWSETIVLVITIMMLIRERCEKYSENSARHDSHRVAIG